MTKLLHPKFQECVSKYRTENCKKIFEKCEELVAFQTVSPSTTHSKLKKNWEIAHDLIPRVVDELLHIGKCSIKKENLVLETDTAEQTDHHILEDLLAVFAINPEENARMETLEGLERQEFELKVLFWRTANLFLEHEWNESKADEAGIFIRDTALSKFLAFCCFVLKYGGFAPFCIDGFYHYLIHHTLKSVFSFSRLAFNFERTNIGKKSLLSSSAGGNERAKIFKNIQIERRKLYLQTGIEILGRNRRIGGVTQLLKEIGKKCNTSHSTVKRALQQEDVEHLKKVIKFR